MTFDASCNTFYDGDIYNIKNVIASIIANDFKTKDKLENRGKKAILQMIRRNSIKLHIYHNHRYHYYRKCLHYLFRIPCLVLSGTNGFFAIGLKEHMNQNTLSLLNAGISFITGILCSIEILFNFQKRMETELETYKKFYILSVKINKDLLTLNKKSDLDKLVTDNLTLYFEASNGTNIINNQNKSFMDEFERLVLGDDCKSKEETKKIKKDLSLVYRVCGPSKCCGKVCCSFYDVDDKNSSSFFSCCCDCNKKIDEGKLIELLKEFAKYKPNKEECDFMKSIINNNNKNSRNKSIKKPINKEVQIESISEKSVYSSDNEICSFDMCTDLDLEQGCLCEFCENCYDFCCCNNNSYYANNLQLQLCTTDDSYDNDENNDVDYKRYSTNIESI